MPGYAPCFPWHDLVALTGSTVETQVLLCRMKRTQLDYAVKVMLMSFIQKEQKVPFVLTEKRIQSGLNHRNIVKLKYAFKDSQYLYMVMDLCVSELLKVIQYVPTCPCTLEVWFATGQDSSLPLLLVAVVCCSPRVHRDKKYSSGVKDAALDLDATRWYVSQIVTALEYLHVQKHVVHRDLKPENILITKEGHVQITDFGTAKVRPSSLWANYYTALDT